MSLSVFTLIVLVTLAAELPDKSMILTLLAARENGPAKTVAAGITGLGIQALGASFLAYFVASLVKGSVLHLVSAVLMLLIALILAITAFRHNEEDGGISLSSGFIRLASLYFLAELGDVTEATTAGFAIRYGNPELVALAALLGMTLAMVAGIIVGKSIEMLPRKWIYLGASVTLAILGALSLLGVSP